MTYNISDYLIGSGTKSICIVGLGYVGLPLAVLFSKKYNVYGLDINQKRIKELKENFDINEDVATEELKKTKIQYLNLLNLCQLDFNGLKDVDVFIVTVPTPIHQDKQPDLAPVKYATQMIVKCSNPKNKILVIYESTVYPGVTEEICVPILSKDHYVWKKDFHVGYSPERINPGDKVHCVKNTTKIVSGDDEETTKFIYELYSGVIEAKIHIAPNIKTAEAAKIIENVQRDLNIALINELALIFHEIGIDTKEVLEAAGTKWNFHKYEPGLVGGHCIGVDPYYLTYKAEMLGYHPEVILSGRRINDNMGKYIAENTIKKLIESGKKINGANILILGITFKENITDIRNSRVGDIYNELKNYHTNPFVYDPKTDPVKVEHEYGITLCKDPELHKPYEAIVVAVKHNVFKEQYSLDKLKEMSTSPLIIVDIKGLYDKKECLDNGFVYWRL